MYDFVVYLHVLSGLTLFLAHGGSAAAAYQLRRESNLERIQALLDLSSSTLIVLFISLLGIFLAGIIAGFMGNWWGRGWIWTALFLLVLITGWMNYYSRRHYSPLRRAAGMSYMQGNKPQPAQPPASADEISKLIRETSPLYLTLVGYVGPAVILWLMIFKPF